MLKTDDKDNFFFVKIIKKKQEGHLIHSVLRRRGQVFPKCVCTTYNSQVFILDSVANIQTGHK